MAFSFSGFGGSSTNKPLFGAVTSSQPASNLFPTAQASQPPQTNSIFGASTSQPQQTSLFGTSTQSQQGSSLFPNAPSQSQQPGSLFGAASQTAGGLNLPGFSKPTGSSFFQPQNTTTQAQSGSTQQPTVLQYSQIGQQQPQNPPIWEPGRGQTVYRTIPAQIQTLQERWNPSNFSSPFRTYLYQKVPENDAPFYQPTQADDEHKWEEAVENRPGPEYVPALAAGFWALGKRAQRQREWIEAFNVRLHEINSSLDAQLELHAHQIASRLSECRRKHLVVSQRTLALAAKVQVLRNRGYVMDNAEETLKAKLKKLEAEVFDPTLNGREQEIWARMIGIRENSKALQAELERMKPTAPEEEKGLDEDTVKAAKNVSTNIAPSVAATFC
ncbi:MAG: hypothetical protein Q9227_004657 [Pyrenula ochraceoflavens]